MVFGEAAGAGNIPSGSRKPDNDAKSRPGPVLARRAGHCVVARSSRIHADMLVARAAHCPARRSHHFWKVLMSITLISLFIRVHPWLRIAPVDF